MDELPPPPASVVRLPSTESNQSTQSEQSNESEQSFEYEEEDDSTTSSSLYGNILSLTQELSDCCLHAKAGIIHRF